VQIVGEAHQFPCKNRRTVEERGSVSCCDLFDHSPTNKNMTNNTELMPLILAGDGYQMTLSSASSNS
jgi:hypothetical protein